MTDPGGSVDTCTQYCPYNYYPHPDGTCTRCHITANNNFDQCIDCFNGITPTPGVQCSRCANPWEVSWDKTECVPECPTIPIGNNQHQVINRWMVGNKEFRSCVLC